MSEVINISGIVNDSITDGPGLRLALFLQGCDKRCVGCHNPHTWGLTGGTPMTSDQIFDKIKANPLLTGITLSGGEPFLQAQSLIPLVKRVRDELNLEVAAYTGNILEDMLKSTDTHILRLIALCDTIIDGPFEQDKRSLTLRFRGSSNQRIIDVAATLVAGHIVLDTTPRWNN